MCFGTVMSSRSSGRSRRGDGGFFAGFQVDAGAPLGGVFGRFPGGRVANLRVFPIQDVGDLGPVAGSKATCLARINFLARDLDPGALVRGAEDLPDVPFRNRDPGLAVDVDHFDHVVLTLAGGIGNQDLTSQ